MSHKRKLHEKVIAHLIGIDLCSFSRHIPSRPVHAIADLARCKYPSSISLFFIIENPACTLISQVEFFIMNKLK